MFPVAPHIGRDAWAGCTHGAAVVVCDRVVAGVFLGIWMAHADEVVVKARDWDCETVLMALEAGRVRSMVLAVCGSGEGQLRPRGPGEQDGRSL